MNDDLQRTAEAFEKNWERMSSVIKPSPKEVLAIEHYIFRAQGFAEGVRYARDGGNRTARED